MSAIEKEEIDTLNCWRCHGLRERPECHKCSGTGSVYWFGGYAYPRTPAGETEVREEMRRQTRLRR